VNDDDGAGRTWDAAVVGGIFGWLLVRWLRQRSFRKRVESRVRIIRILESDFAGSELPPEEFGAFTRKYFEKNPDIVAELRRTGLGDDFFGPFMAGVYDGLSEDEIQPIVHPMVSRY